MPPAQLQFALPGSSALNEAVERLARSGVEERGAVYTRREVVEFILDLVGYEASRPLHKQRLLEPSFGAGAFLIPALERLLTAFKTQAGNANPVLALRDAVRGIELHRPTYEATTARVKTFLQEQGLNAEEARLLTQAWFQTGDFLLVELEPVYDYVIGNPPYVRQELIPDLLLGEYRRRYQTLYDRADLYVPFIERGLRLLAPSGGLGVICADRWTKNRYGGPLRDLVARSYRLRTYVDMVDTAAFHTEVVAYPAIFVISNEAPGPTRIAHRPPIEGDALAALAASLRGDAMDLSVRGPTEVARVATGAEPWILDGLDQLAVVRRLEADFPLLEEAGCCVGIGVATGADGVFIGLFDDLDVESDRKLPLAMSHDIVSGVVRWRGYGVINPFLPDGRLAPLDKYPQFARFVERHESAIRGRHTAKKNPASWYRTIDRIYPNLAERPKLLIPDIKGDANIVYEGGTLYPHHNLYHITSKTWDLHALQAVLLSGIARLFVATYSTKMRGGYLRYQAQYLRRIRLPRWETVPQSVRSALVRAAAHKDKAACDAAVATLYNLSASEREAILGNA